MKLTLLLHILQGTASSAKDYLLRSKPPPFDPKVSQPSTTDSKNDDAYTRRLDRLDCNAANACDDLCMNAVWKDISYGDKGTNLGCTAKEVTAVADDVQGPEFCEIGERVRVNVTANITFNTVRLKFSILFHILLFYSF